MNYDEPEHIVMLRESLRRFLDREMPRELARELDKTMAFPAEAFEKLRDLGITGLTTPEQYGGAGVDILAAVITIEELCRRGTSLAGPYIHCVFYGAMNVLENGNEEQKQRFLPALARGEMFFAYGLSEPDVGGNLAEVTTTGRLTDDCTKIVINGTKRWCTGARFADYIYTLVRTGDQADKYKNLSLVMVPRDSQGISLYDIEHTGLRYAHTTDVVFEDVEVPAELIVGGLDAVNAGWDMLIGRGLDVERLEISATAFGIAIAAVEDAWSYAKERRQFGKPIAGHQSVAHALVDARTKLEACRQILYRAAWLANEGRDCSVESSMAKLFVAETGVEIVIACQRVMGAYGCANEYDMERYVRDILCMPIVGGSSNMQRNNIGGRLGLRA